MKITKEIINSIIDSFNEDKENYISLADYISEELQEIAMVQQRKHDIKISEQDIFKERNEKMELIKQQIAKLQKECKHWSFSHVSGFGGHDSYNECDFCGKEL